MEEIFKTIDEYEADMLIVCMLNNAVWFIHMELNINNWNILFGDGVVTPIGKVKIGENQYAKLLQKGRVKEFGLIKETLINPDIILKESTKTCTKPIDRPFSYLFIKAFKVSDNDRKIFMSVSIKKDSLEIIVSSHYVRLAALRKKLLKDLLIYKNRSIILQQL